MLDAVRRLKVFLKLLAVNRSQSILKLKSKGPLEKFGEKCYLSCIGQCVATLDFRFDPICVPFWKSLESIWQRRAQCEAKSTLKLVALQSLSHAKEI